MPSSTVVEHNAGSGPNKRVGNKCAFALTLVKERVCSTANVSEPFEDADLVGWGRAVLRRDRTERKQLQRQRHLIPRQRTQGHVGALFFLNEFSFGEWTCQYLNLSFRFPLLSHFVAYISLWSACRAQKNEEDVASLGMPYSVDLWAQKLFCPSNTGLLVMVLS